MDSNEIENTPPPQVRLDESISGDMFTAPCEGDPQGDFDGGLVEYFPFLASFVFSALAARKEDNETAPPDGGLDPNNAAEGLLRC